jgi:hypothetical protein
MGFMSVYAMYSALGFIVACFGLCWVIGFDDKYSLHRSLLSSAILVSVAFGLRNLPMFKPFLPAFYIFSVVIYFLALLIMTSKHYDYSYEGTSRYFALQLLMIASCACSLWIGTLYSIPSFYNIGMTFLFLYTGEKLSEQHMFKDVVVVIFCAGCALFGASFYFFAHPEFLMSLIVL